jgi:hypothetical protein
MKPNIFDKILGGAGLQRTVIGDSMVPVEGYWDVKVVRHDGAVEEKTLKNIVTANGLNLIADRLMNDTGSKAAWLAVGSWLTSPTLSTSAFGEVVGGRKVGAISNSSREWAYNQATWGGAADGITSVDLQQAALCNHQTSGTGTVVNIVEGLSTVLADSDFLNLTVRIRVGSHNLADT